MLDNAILDQISESCIIEKNDATYKIKMKQSDINFYTYLYLGRANIQNIKPIKYEH